MNALRSKPLVLAVCLAILAIALLPLVVQGQTADQEPVADDAGIFTGRMSEVEAAVNALREKGADVRVRTITSYSPYANLDLYEAALEQSSPSWLGTDGNIKNNLIVIIIAVDERQSGLYYGSLWASALDDDWNRIQTDVMHPLFREGDYAGGTVEGLNEIGKAIDTGGQAGSDWSVPLAIAVIVGILALAALIYLYRRRKAREEAWRHRATLTKQAAASGINELLEANQMLEIKVGVIADKVSSEEAAPLREALERSTASANRSSQAYSELAHSAGDPENPKLGAPELETIDNAYSRILGDIREGKETVKDLETRISRIQEAISALSTKIAAAESTLADARTREKELQGAGFRTAHIDELMEEAIGPLEQAKDLASRKKHGEGLKLAELAGEKVGKVSQAVEELPHLKQQAELAMPVLSTRIDEVKEHIISGKEVFDRLFDEYAASTWDPVKGNGTEAENRVNWATDALGDSRALAGEQGDWYQAMEVVNKANTWLAEAESLVRSIPQLEEKLILARRDSPVEIAAASTDINRAWEYIHRYDEDIRESLEDELRAAERKNQDANEELQKEKPDYFLICKQAREANSEADKILIEARNEHEAAERLRAKAASTHRDARAKVSIARNYIQDHAGVVKSEARGYLSSATSSLDRAGDTADLNDRVALLLTAESDAERAYSLAKRDVYESWQRPRDLFGPVPDPGRTGFPPIFFPERGPSTPAPQPWGTSRPGGPVPAPSRTRPSSWGASGGPSLGGGPSGWGSPGSQIGRGSRRGGGSSGW